MNLTPVSSSNLRAVGYDPDREELTIQFHDSGVYTYINVPKHIYDGLMSASSKGSYHHQYVKKYRFRKGY